MSLDNQEEACLALADGLGYEVTLEFRFREVWSGADLHRPKLDELRLTAVRGSVKGVIVYHPIRLGRDPLHISMTYAELRASGLDVQFVLGNMEDTPEGRLLLYVQGYAGQQGRRLFAENSMKAKRHIAKSGRMPVGGGAGQYGYDYDHVIQKRVINEAEAVAVRTAFELRFNRLNDNQIQSRLEELGFRSKKGKVLQHRTVSRMLSNESYAGMDCYGRCRWRKVEGTKKREVTPLPKEEWIPIDDFTPPIISRAVFDRAQEIKCDPSTRVVSEKKQCVMTGFSRGSGCTAAVVGSCMCGRYRYYHCRATTAQPPKCRERYIPADDYEEEAWTVFSEAIREPETVVAEFWSHLNVDTGDTADEEAKVRREVEELRREQARMLELRRKDTEGLFDDEIFLAQLAPVKALYDEKRRALAVLEEQRRNKDDASLVEERIVEMCQQVSAGLEDLDFWGRGGSWKPLVSRFTSIGTTSGWSSR